MKVIGLSKAFGIQEIFRDVSFEIRLGERVGLVGANGAGKTTLLRCLLGKEDVDAGKVQFDDGAVIGYVEQQATFGEGTLYDELRRVFADVIALGEKKRVLEQAIEASGEAAQLLLYGRIADEFEHLGGYSLESQIRRVAFGLGFTKDDFSKDVRHFSGGQRTRICLAKALLRAPDFLFLDEPTNHLDIQMIEWLEEFLREYKGGVVLISHDRFFLDRVATNILYLRGGKVTAYAGNYTYFKKVHDERQKSLRTAYEKQQEHIRRTKAYISRYRAGIKAKQARGRESQLRRLDLIVPEEEAARFKSFCFPSPSECAERVAELDDVSFSFGEQTVLFKASFLVRRQDACAIVGANGAGKTTLLRILLGDLKPTAGRVKIGSRVKIGYFSQQHEGLNFENTLLDELNAAFGIAEDRARKYLGAFFFHGDDVFRRIGDLSGGEKARLTFLKLMLTGANFLVLDEPTNHLDIAAREAVEKALAAFSGAFIVVSHDRYFLDKVTNKTIELKDGRLKEYEGNYSYYRVKKNLPKKEVYKVAKEKSPNAKKKAVDAPKKTMPYAYQTLTKKNAATGKEQSLRLATLSDAKRREMIARKEAEIAMKEAELKGLEFEMNDSKVQSDPKKSAAIALLYASKEKELDECYESWEMLFD